ncbi:MAG: histidine--tRNA ligase [Bacteroidales bacterium]|nr:histidine--tRNA ligase [Bacteroidales bacterium]
MIQKPSIPKGTRDFGPEEMSRRNYIFDNIRSVFQKYAFQPIETPAMENLSSLLGKYGDEGDKLLFRILNSGDFAAKIDEKAYSEKDSSILSGLFCEKGLRYDLTVPFARFVVQNRNEISFPFKRYQIQPVWRADRPQRGRYREFYQCDVDVIGSNSLFNELELIQIIDEVFELLNLKVAIKLNNRKVLAGIAEIIGHPEKIIDITVAIDKLDKIGQEKVNQELAEKGLDKGAIDKLQPFLLMKGSNEEKLNLMRKHLSNSEVGTKGLDELQKVFSYLNLVEVNVPVELDLTLARGLNYYTGAIFEVKSTEVEIGSICGGGRYDDLTGIFGLPDVSGVGISFGADRIYDVLLQLNRFPESARISSKIMFVNFGEKEAEYCIQQLAKLREAGISSELYPDSAKMKKQMSYADNKKIPFVAIVGENEIQQEKINLKNMETGEQKLLKIDELISSLISS